MRLETLSTPTAEDMTSTGMSVTLTESTCGETDRGGNGEKHPLGVIAEGAMVYPSNRSDEVNEETLDLVNSLGGFTAHRFSAVKNPSSSPTNS